MQVPPPSIISGFAQHPRHLISNCVTDPRCMNAKIRPLYHCTPSQHRRPTGAPQVRGWSASQAEGWGTACWYAAHAIYGMQGHHRCCAWEHSHPRAKQQYSA